MQSFVRYVWAADVSGGVYVLQLRTTWTRKVNHMYILIRKFVCPWLHSSLCVLCTVILYFLIDFRLFIDMIYLQTYLWYLQVDVYK
jgi:hypothetical protein